MAEKAETKVHKDSLNVSSKTGTPLTLMSSGSGGNGGGGGGGSHTGSNGNTSANKPDIKVSADGVAKLNFSFLEETCDSSLEPGEVVTPPQSNSPVPNIVTKVLPISSLATNITASQREALVCKEKVRAILEIDAKKRKEENEKRKQDLEKRRESGELEAHEAEKRKEKAERKRIKRIEKEQRAARLALMSDDNDEQRGITTVDQTSTSLATQVKAKTINKTKRISEDRESYESGERVSSSGDEGDTGRDRSERLERNEPPVRSVVNSVAMNAATTFHSTTMPEGYSGPGAVGGGTLIFRPMFPRHMRPDFHHARGGGFMLRGRGGGRGGMNNNLRHPLYRSPFFGNGPRGHVPYHVLNRQPHAARGHSPIMVPPAELRWTKTQPPISFSSRQRNENKFAAKLSKKSESTTATTTSNQNENAQENEERKRKSAKKKLRKSQKKNKKRTKKKFKAKSKSKTKSKDKDKERDSKKEKEKRNATRTEHREKSNLRKIVKIRNSLEKAKTAKDVDGNGSSGADVAGGKSMESKNANDLEKKLQASNDAKVKPALKLNIKEERKNRIQTTKEHKSKQSDTDTTPDYDEMPQILTIKQEKGVIVDEAKNDNDEANKSDSNNKPPVNNLYDIFAESPPRIAQAMQAASNKKEKLESIEQKNVDSPRSATPPIELLAKSKTTTTTTKAAAAAVASGVTHAEKSQLQKTLEMRQRIGKLLQDDDLLPEKLEATKEKLLQKTQNLVYGPAPPPQAVTVAQLPAIATPQTSFVATSNQSLLNKKNHSVNDASKIDQQQQTKRKTSYKESQQVSTSTSNPTTTTPKRKYSQSPKSQKSKVLKLETKSKDKHAAAASQKPKKPTSATASTSKASATASTRLSFNASEFLFPDEDNIDDDDSRSSSNNKKHVKDISKSKQPFEVDNKLDDDVYDINNDDLDVDVDDDLSTTLSLQQHKRQQSTSSHKLSNSPDTDDYMDNWELDDDSPDSPNIAAIDFKSSKNTLLEKSIKTPTKTTTTLEKPTVSSYSTAPAPGTVRSDITISTEQNSMQDIYNEFIKSVEATGVDVTNTSNNTNNTTVTDVSKQTNVVGIIEKQQQQQQKQQQSPLKRAGKRNLSTSSNSSTTSTTSTSSSSTGSSSSTESSGESSTTAASSSSTNSKSSLKTKNKKVKPVLETATAATATTRHQQTLTLEPKSIKSEIKTEKPSSDKPAATTKEDATATSSNSSNYRLDPLEVLNSVLPQQPNEQQKQQISKDLKRVKSYDANLRRTQLMRVNFDASDEIYGELAKMEKLFKDAINFVIQKYTKDRQLLLQTDDEEENLLKPTLKLIENKTVTAPTTTTTTPTKTTPNVLAPIAAATAESLPPATAAETEVVNKIFDSNRETIKLTIAPLKLAKATTAAIFDKLDKNSTHASTEQINATTNQQQKRGSGTALDLLNDDADFTETLVKTTKEIAIVKPMSKSGRSPSPRRSSSNRSSKKTSPRSSVRRSHGSSGGSTAGPTSRRRSNSRSESIYRGSDQRMRRSTSRSTIRGNNQRRKRTLSPTTTTSRRAGRNTSPMSSHRYREQRGRSPMRRGMTRRDHVSPIPQQQQQQHRRRQQQQRLQRHYDMRASYSRSQTRSRSRSPRSPRSPNMLAHYRHGAGGGGCMGNRPHSPRSPPPQRRSYSRDSYSRSPLPFKPPSPPEQENVDAKRTPHNRRSRSFSGTPSPTSNLRRSRSRSHSRSRSRSPRSPRSPLSPRPHTPPLHYDEREGSYDRYHQHHRRSSQTPPPSHSQHNYFEPAMAAHSSTNLPASAAYYYTMPPNVLHNGPAPSDAEQRWSNETNYEQYQGVNVIATTAYLTTHNEYYASHFDAHMYSHHHQQQQQQQHHHQQQQQQGMHIAPPMRPSNFYYNQQQQMQQLQQPPPMHPSYLLKPIRKEGTFAVQKGNVLEIVPSETTTPTSNTAFDEASIATIAATTNTAINHEPIEQTKIKMKTTNNANRTAKILDPIKAEIIMRLQASAKLKKARKNQVEGTAAAAAAAAAVPIKSSILRKETNAEANTTTATTTVTTSLDAKTTLENETSNLATAAVVTETVKPLKKPRKKVLFEDGLFPNRDSGDEDEQDAEKRLRLELRRLRRKGRKAVTVLYLLSNRKPGSKQKPTASDLAKLPPPPPPALMPPPNVEQPVPNRPTTPPQFMFYHYDAVVQALYTSPSERGIPPRLTDPKAAAIFGAGKSLGAANAAAVAAAVHAHKPRSSPVFNIKREHATMAALKSTAAGSSGNGSIGASANTSGRSSSSPQLPQSPFYGGSRRIHLSFNKHQPPPSTAAAAPPPSPAAAMATQSPFSPITHQQQQQLRFTHNSPVNSPISTLLTQPLAQAKISTTTTANKPTTMPMPTPIAAATFQAIATNSPQMPMTPTYGPVAVVSGAVNSNTAKQLQQHKQHQQQNNSQANSPPVCFAAGNMHHQTPIHARVTHQQQQQQPHTPSYSNMPIQPSAAVNVAVGNIRSPMTQQQSPSPYSPYGPQLVRSPHATPAVATPTTTLNPNQNLPQRPLPPPSVQNFDAIS